jgi:hypothetical protein
MSWDVMIFKIRGNPPPSIEKINESDTQPLGPAAEVRREISEALPGVDWSDPTWGTYSGSGNEFSIEFNVSNDDPVDNMMLHVRGSGDALSPIMAVVRPRAWAAFDCTTGEFLDPQNLSDRGWRAFQEFRDKIVGRGGPVVINAGMSGPDGDLKHQDGSRTSLRRHDPRLWAAGSAWLGGICVWLCTRSSPHAWRISGLLAGLLTGAAVGFAMATLLNRRRR